MSRSSRGMSALEASSANTAWKYTAESNGRTDLYKINTASYHFTTFAFLPLLSAAKSIGNYAEPGNVIILSSMSGITSTSQRGQFNYNASKAATISLSKMLATEFARRNLGVRVNCVCPGFFPSVSTPSSPRPPTVAARLTLPPRACRCLIKVSRKSSLGDTGVSPWLVRAMRWTTLSVSSDSQL